MRGRHRGAGEVKRRERAAVPGAGVSPSAETSGTGRRQSPPHPLELRQDSPRGTGKVVALAGNRESGRNQGLVGKQLCQA